jgi:hypothetical protein
MVVCFQFHIKYIVNIATHTIIFYMIGLLTYLINIYPQYFLTKTIILIQFQR